MRPAKHKLDPEQALLRWMIETQKRFTELEQRAFKDLLNSLDTSAPIKTAHTFRNGVQRKLLNWTGRLRQDLAYSCHSILVSLDLWTSENQVPFLGIVGHWLTEDFKSEKNFLISSRLRDETGGRIWQRESRAYLKSLKLQRNS